MAEETTREVFLDLRQSIDEASRKWSGYLHAVGGAYASAYQSQELILTAIKNRIQAASKQEQEMMIFFLTMLTMGVGGPLLTYFVKLPNYERAALANLVNTGRVSSSLMKNKIAPEFIGDSANAAYALLNDWPLKHSVAWLSGENDIAAQPSAPIPVDPFVPVGMSPTEYAEALQQGNDEAGSLLAEGPAKWYRDADKYSTSLAKQGRETILAMPYIKGAPPAQMDKATEKLLKPRAKLALWVAWALGRDEKYWAGQAAVAPFGTNSEVWAWEPLRQELIQLGVPATKITIKSVTFKGIRQGLDMAAFMEWARSPEASYRIFNGFISGDNLKLLIKKFNEPLWITPAN